MWLLVWVVAGATGADLPEDQTFTSQERCQAAAATMTELSETTGAGGRIAVTVKADCIEIEAETPAPPR